MRGRLRKFTLTAHVSSSVSWMGAILVYLALASASISGPDPETARAGFLILHKIAYTVIVPLSLAALLTGLIQSLRTEWGIVRYYWVLAKVVLTVPAVAILLMHLPTIGRMSRLAAVAPLADLGALRLQLVVHAAGALLVLLTVTALSIYKPWGKIGFGRRAVRSRTA